ncbi:MAG TPA: NlpC/P60 family protein [Rugosimonospora sp.]
MKSLTRRQMLGWCVAGAAAAGSLGAAPVLAPQVKERLDRSQVKARAKPLFGRYRYVRLDGPDRTMVYDEHSMPVATLTQDARSVVFTGSRRRFAEPATTTAHIDTDAWVRLAPRPWRFGAQAQSWFTEWFTATHGSTDLDAMGVAMQYVTGRPRLVADNGVAYAGDAGFGPLLDGQRDQHSDFYDYLGVSWTWPDGTTSAPRANRYRDVDCSGFLRLVWGYRMGMPLVSGPPQKDVAGLPREAHEIAVSDLVVPLFDSGAVAPSAKQLTQLQPGDLVFFALHSNPRYLSHAGMFLGEDNQEHLRFISSRSTVNGPTIGDVGGVARLEGRGYYPRALRKAVRL